MPRLGDALVLKGLLGRRPVLLPVAAAMNAVADERAGDAGCIWVRGWGRPPTVGGDMLLDEVFRGGVLLRGSPAGFTGAPLVAEAPSSELKMSKVVGSALTSREKPE